MTNLNNIHIPLIKTKADPDPSTAPDIKDPSSYCKSYNSTFMRRSNYYMNLINIHHIPRHILLEELRKKPKVTKPTIDILSLYCNICTKTYTTKRYYIRYLLKFHGVALPHVYSEPDNSEPKSFYCGVRVARYKSKRIFTLSSAKHTSSSNNLSF